MPKLARLEIETKYSPALAAEIADVYKAHVEQKVCMVCGRHQKPGDKHCDQADKTHPGCGVADAIEAINHNLAVQGTRSVMHRRVCDLFKIDDEAGWSLIDGSASDGHHAPIGFVQRAGFAHDFELEQKLRDEHEAAKASLGKVCT